MNGNIFLQIMIILCCILILVHMGSKNGKE